MRDKRPIAEQVADMTEEQKNNVVKSFWIQIIAGILIALIALTPAIVFTVAMVTTTHEISEVHDDLAEAYSFSEILNLHEKADKLEDKYNDLKKSRDMSIWIGIPTVIVICVVAEIVIRIKMPYYGDKKALYIMKQRRADKKAAKQ